MADDKTRDLMLPATLTIVDDDGDYREFLAQHMRAQGLRVRTFSDSNHLLADGDPFGDAFYIIDLMLPGVGGEELIRILRLRNEECGVLVITGKAEAGVFENVLTAGGQVLVADAAAQGGGNADHEVELVFFGELGPAGDDVAVILRRLGQRRG